MPADLFEQLQRALPEPERVAAIRETVRASMRPVRPLPSNAVLVLLLLVAFLILVVLGAAPVGLAGFRTLGDLQRVIVAIVIAAAAALLATAAVEQMIPGSRHRVPAIAAVLLTLAALALAVPVLFPDYSLHGFVSQGYPCLRLGLICAAPPAAAAGFMMRWGCLTDPVRASLTAGALSGLVGVSVLALHCPILNTPHILAWHVGVILLCALAGAAAGFALTWNRART